MDQKTALFELEKALIELNSTSVGRRAFLIAMPALLASCATPSKHRHREGDNTGQKADLTPEQERKLTQDALVKMRKDYPPVRDPELQKYIAGLGQRVVQASNLNGRPYKYNFTVVDVPYVNAFALPAGTIFVTAPLIEMADTEAELAGVVGHEVGHVVARHTAERMYVAKKESKKTIWYALGGALLGGAAGYGLGSLMCKPKDKECLQRAAAYGAAAGAGGGLLIQKYGFMANSREDEMEADRIGFKTSVQAGFDKDHVGDFYTKLQKMEEERKRKGSPLLAPLADAMSTHPPSKERVNQMNQMEAQTSKKKGAIVSRKSFERAKVKAARAAARARARQPKRS